MSVYRSLHFFHCKFTQFQTLPRFLLELFYFVEKKNGNFYNFTPVPNVLYFVIKLLFCRQNVNFLYILLQFQTLRTLFYSMEKIDIFLSWFYSSSKLYLLSNSFIPFEKWEIFCFTCDNQILTDPSLTMIW